MQLILLDKNDLLLYTIFIFTSTYVVHTHCTVM
jgi:hypothetical protein